MTTRTLVITLLTATACLGQTKPAASKTMGASIFGFVQTDEPLVERGKPVASPWVTLIRQPSNPKEKIVPFSKGRAARPDGAFSFSGLAPGLYQICAQQGGGTLLNPCEWGGSQSIVKLQAEQIVSKVVVAMTYGVAVPIRVEDPQQLLTKHEGKTQGAHLMIGVADSHGMFHQATVVGTDSKGRDHRVIVPADRPVKLSVKSTFFSLADDKGSAVPKGGTDIPIPVASGGPDKGAGVKGGAAVAPGGAVAPASQKPITVTVTGARGK